MNTPSGITTVDITPAEAEAMKDLNAWPKKLEVVTSDGSNRMKDISKAFTTLAVGAMRKDPRGWKDALESRGDQNVIDVGRSLGARKVALSAGGETMLFDFAGLPDAMLAKNGFPVAYNCGPLVSAA